MSPSFQLSTRDPERAVEIYRAAARIFASKGYHATSIHEVAEAVHLTKAGLYYYIKGKQDLLFRIMEFALDALEREVVEVARAETDLARRLRRTVECHAALILAGRDELSILVNELEGLTPEKQQVIRARQLAYVHFIRDTLKKLRSEGRLNDVDPTAGAFAIVGMVLWLARWFQPGGRLDQKEVIEDLARLALHGVLADAGAGERKRVAAKAVTRERANGRAR
jgi:TetR/AcrR family transcriptional regulator, cholesterol catabolism regulator